MPSSEQIAKLLFKDALGVGHTDDSRAFFEESIAAKRPIFPTQVWNQAGEIPASAPTLAADAISGVVQYKVKLALTPVAGTANAFYHADLADAVPMNYGPGYAFSIFDSANNPIVLGQGDWAIKDGILKFHGTVPANMPPSISFYKYIGKKGVGSSDVFDIRSFENITGAELLTKAINNELEVSAKYFVTDKKIIVRAISPSLLDSDAVYVATIPDFYKQNTPDYVDCWYVGASTAINKIYSWNGLMYRNKTGVNTASAPVNDATNWQLIDPETSELYITEYYTCKYDLENNWIYYLLDTRGNEFKVDFLSIDKNGWDSLQPHDLWQFGNNKVYGNVIDGAACIEIINMRPSRGEVKLNHFTAETVIRNITFDQNSYFYFNHTIFHGYIVGWKIGWFSITYSNFRYCYFDSYNSAIPLLCDINNSYIGEFQVTNCTGSAELRANNSAINKLDFSGITNLIARIHRSVVAQNDPISNQASLTFELIDDLYIGTRKLSESDAVMAQKADLSYVNENLGIVNSFYYPNGDSANQDQYGLLYTYENALKLAPDGWRLPTQNDLQYWLDYYPDSPPVTDYFQLSNNAAGRYDLNSQLYEGFGQATQFANDDNSAHFYFDEVSGGYWSIDTVGNNYAIPIRFVKDDDGSADDEITVDFYGKSYRVQRLDDGLIWMLENLSHPIKENKLDSKAEKTYVDAKVQEIRDLLNISEVPTTNSYYPDGNPANPGFLYTYARALELVPAGWRLPTESDWNGVSVAMAENELLMSHYNGMYSGSSSSFSLFGMFATYPYSPTNTFFTNYSTNHMTGGTWFPDNAGSIRLVKDSDPLVPNQGDTAIITLYGKEYTIGHLSDGKVWLLEDFAYAEKLTEFDNKADKALESIIEVVANTLTLDFNKYEQLDAISQTAVGASFTVVLSNAENAKIFSYALEISVTSLITLPSNFVSDDSRWDAATLQLTLEPGIYELSAKYLNLTTGKWSLKCTGGLI